MAKQKHKVLDCETCEGHPPALSHKNLMFLKTWKLICNSFYYVGTMDGVYPTGLNWSNVETILRMFNIKQSRALIKKIRLAEKLSLKQSTERIKKE